MVTRRLTGPGGEIVNKKWRDIRGWCAAMLCNVRGATTAEYAMLLALVVVILIGTLSQLGQALNTKLVGIISSLNEAR